MELTQNEQMSLEVFTSDAVLFSLVEKVLRGKLNEGIALALSSFELTPETYTNEELGSQIRACMEGKRLVEATFRELRLYRKELPKEEKINRAI